ncbi:MAG: penicillin-binding protein activator [Gammaproteobacteria bacterium]|nr:penicillin-binding protein activator [Gammaproteobacteria bacterium]
MQRDEPPVVSAADARATALADQGRYDDAAEAYLQLAGSAAGPARERYLIQAARQRRLAGKLGGAQAILDSLSDPVDDSNLLGWAQVAGDLAVARGQPRRALEIVARAPATSKPGAAAELERIRGEALFRLGDPVAATRAFQEREIWLRDPAEIAANQRMLWIGYQRWGDSLTPALVEGVDDVVTAGWLELGYIAATRRDSRAGLGLALQNWQTRFPTHPANDVLLPELLSDFQGIAAMPERLALLLPLSGRQKAAGQAVRDGFLAAHFASADITGQAPVIRIYDIDAMGVLPATQTAVLEGAQFVVGPLLKESVQELAASGIAAPTLALNFLPDELPAPAGMVQFALAPEDEAVQAADRAIAEGHRRAVVLVPSNGFGRRLLDSFVATYTGLGGQVIDYRFFDPRSPDFSYGIQDMLLIGESRDRHDRLSANLRMELGFEPRRRDDIDLIFLGARPEAGKLIRPQLKFFYAGGVPTYSTSAIYQENSRNNSDLNGIIFPDMPWLVEPDAEIQAVRDTLDALWPGDASRRARLFAMGFDAYRLVPELAGGTTSGGGEVAGATGRLYLDGDGRIHRRLVWAQMRGGRPARLEPLIGASPEILEPIQAPETTGRAPAPR